MRRLLVSLLPSLLLLPLAACGGGEAPSPGGGDGTTPPTGSDAPAPGPGAQDPDIDPSQPAYLRVTLKLKGTGEPMGNVPFDVQWYEEDKPSSTSSRTDPDGSRRIAFEHGSRLIGVVPRSSPFTAPTFQAESAVLMGGRTYEVEVVVPPSGVVTGSVLDESGEPVPGIQVVAFFSSPEAMDRSSTAKVDSFTTTDEQGRYAIGGFPEGPFVLEAGDESRVSVFRPGGLIREGQRLDGLDIQIEPAHAVYGQVTDEMDRPIEGARVVAGKPKRRQNRRDTQYENVHLYQARAAVTRSDEQGLFTLPNVPDSQTWNINVSHPEYRRHTGSFDAGQVDLWITLSKGAELAGTVLDGEGAAMNQVQVWLFLPDGQETQFTDRQGRFSFAGRDVRDGVYLLFYKPGAGMVLEGPMSLAAGSEPVDVELDGGQELAGFVRDASGEPVAGAMVTIEGRLPEDGFLRARMPERFLDLDSQLSAADGSFRFTELHDNHYTVRATVPGKGSATLEMVPAGNRKLALTLEE